MLNKEDILREFYFFVTYIFLLKKIFTIKRNYYNIKLEVNEPNDKLKSLIMERKVEKVIFDMQTEHGMDTTHYGFIRNVLETVSSISR